MARQCRWLLWSCAALAAVPIASLMGAAETAWLPATVQGAIRYTANIEYVLFIMVVYAAVIHLRDSALEILTRAGSRASTEGLSASDTGWVFWAAAASLASLSVVLNMAPQNISQEIHLSGNEVIWSGAIGRRAPDIDYLVSNGANVVRLLNNRGGDVGVATEIASRLESLGVTRVIADGQCASSCAHFWFLSPGRELAPYSVIGLHLGQGIRLDRGRRVFDADLTRKVNDELVSAIVGAGASPAVAGQLIAASHNRMNWLSAKDLTAAGVPFKDLSRSSVE